jgi:hypothetical protein
MSKKDLKVLGVIAAAGGAVVAIHGITSKKWQTAHSVFSVLGAVVALATLT